MFSHQTFRFGFYIERNTLTPQILEKSVTRHRPTIMPAFFGSSKAPPDALEISQVPGAWESSAARAAAAVRVAMLAH